MPSATDNVSLQLVSIGELLPGEQPREQTCTLLKTVETPTRKSSFFIPSYQRGYRWRELQVKQLLDDLWDFYETQDAIRGAWYCLQPLVVKSGEEKTEHEKGSWVVIDGQQRLTTLYLILNQLGKEKKELFSIHYETREKSVKFLASPNEGEKDDNPDFYFMWQADTTIKKWMKANEEKLSSGEQAKFVDCILKKSKVIWYETQENHYEVFTRLNSGKISLSNAELIKALLLQSDNFKGDSQSISLQQLERAGEWDRIEQCLHDDEFWYFINPDANPDAENSRFNATRIDFLFEVILRKDKQMKTPKYGFDENYIHAIQANPYRPFAVFAEYCGNDLDKQVEARTSIWSDIQSAFRRIKSWYDDRELYHLVGYLMNQKGEDVDRRLARLCTLLKDAEEQTKLGFFKAIQKMALSSICGSGKVKLDNLSYENNATGLNNILLLFNIALLVRQKSESSRYPFKTHIGTKWSLEHIHAKKERDITQNDIKEIADALGCDAVMKDVNEKLEGLGVKLNVDEKTGQTRLTCDEQEIHGLENLALLDRNRNSSFNNRLFAEKCAILAKWEAGEREAIEKFNIPDFVPLGTRMVFFKHFTPHTTAPFIWGDADGECYLQAIVKTLSDYLNVQPSELISELQNDDTGTKQ